jgi:dTDP-4-dehydrorhamnose reductase
MNILLTGASGGLGSALYKQWTQNHNVLGLRHQNQDRSNLLTLDLRHRSAVLDTVNQFKPDIIVNTVALANVEQCEADISLAFETNVVTALNLRLAAEVLQSKIIHISTNDVFDGKTGMYTEESLVNPVNFYAKSKQMAEQVFHGYEKSLILRLTFLSWTASSKQTFVAWIAESLKKGKAIYLCEDQFYSPLYIGTVVHWIEKLFEAQGVLHLGSERHSRYETGLRLAKMLTTNTKADIDLDLVIPCSIRDLDLSAARPLDVSLNCQKAAEQWQLKTDLDQEIQALMRDYPLF